MNVAGAQGSFDFALHTPGEALRDYCHTFYNIECGPAGIEDVLPSYSPQLLIFAEGAATLRFSTGEEATARGLAVVSQIEEAAQLRLHGPTRLFGISLSIRGWLALGGPSLENRGNRIDSAGSVFGAELVRALTEIRSDYEKQTIQAGQAAEAVRKLLTECATCLTHEQDRFVSVVTDWLESAFDPQLADLHATLEISPRQIQRLSRRYFGRPPSSLAKRRRAVRAAALLASPELPEALEAEIHAAYFDQAHLIRDIRKYTGRTPRRLEADDAALGVESLVHFDRSNDELYEELTKMAAVTGAAAR